MAIVSKFILLLTFLVATTSISNANEYVEGDKMRKVTKLTTESFRTAINDPANPVWFLKFYAYWCGHCKRLAPVLDAAAPQVAGRMAIGKIDCTEEKKLCDEFRVRGYPTLKYSIDGEIFDYPLGRSEEEIVGFADRLSRPPLKLINSVEAALEYTNEETFDHGVSFVCHDPKAKSGSMEQMEENSSILQLCSKAARIQMANAYFTVLDTKAPDLKTLLPKEETVPEPSSSSDDEEGDEAPKKRKKKKYGFVCRLEPNIPPRCLRESKGEKLDSDKVLNFVNVENVATVTELGSANFHRIGRLGRPLVIGVVNVDDEKMVQEVSDALTEYAINGPAKFTNKYYFGWMNGQKWSKFLEQFEIAVDQLPRYFVLNVPDREYWQDPAYADKPLADFVKAVSKGKIEPRVSDGVRGARFLNRIANGFFAWMPWSLLLLLGIATLAVLAVVPNAQELRPPYPKKKEEAAPAGGGEGDPLLGTKKEN